jgi:hypothetical protein
MTLEIFPDLVQASDEWLAARCGILTASQIGKLITPTMKVADNETSRGLTATIVAERITGHVEYVHPSADMQRGTLDEPYARDLYAAQHGPVEEIGFAVETFAGHKLGASPDGLIGSDGGIEIKSRSPKAQLRTILSDEIPAENMAQIQACMLVTGRIWWEYVSYAGGWPLYVKRVHADPDWQTVILAALETFEANAAEMIATYTTVTVGKPVAPRIDHFLEMSF